MLNIYNIHVLSRIGHYWPAAPVARLKSTYHILCVEYACHCCQNELHHEFVVEFCSIIVYFASIKIEKSKQC